MLEGFDVGMEMSGHPTAFRDMLGAMIPGGRVAVLGIPPGDVSMDLNTIVFKGLTLKGVYGREMFETWYKMVALLQNGLDVSGMVTHRFDAQEFREGFETMRSGRSGKVTLDWTTLRKERV
jgi:threonine 3-dehydrogenase